MTRVIIVGGGFAGLSAALKFKNTDVEVLILDKANHHLFQPLLYQVATAALPLSNIASPLREIFRNQPNVTVLMTTVEKIDVDKQQLMTAEQRIFNYDYLILATGATHSYFGHPEWEKYAPGLKTSLDAIHIRDRILMAFEKGEKCADAEEAKRYLNFAIVGAGPTGVEVAGSIAEFAHLTLTKNFRHIQPNKSKIYLIEGLGQVLPSFPKHLGDKALEYLEKLGITVMLNTRVTNITDKGLYIEDRFLDIPTIIWAAGNEASPLLKTLNKPLDRQGRVFVNSTLSIEGHPNVFVLGDAAATKDAHGNYLPAIAPVAIQQGRYVAHIIKKQIPLKDRKPFSYLDKGMVAAIGRGKAVAVLGKLEVAGFFAWFIWGFIHIFYLINFKSRLFVMTHWFFLYLKGKRTDRIIEK
jgi:NADH dehydrogenase